MGKGEGLGETQPHIQPRRVGGPPGVRGQEHQHLPEPLLPRAPPSSDGPTCPLDQQGDAAGALESSPSPSPQTTNQPTGLALSPSHPWPGPTPQSSSGQDAGGRAGATPAASFLAFLPQDLMPSCGICFAWPQPPLPQDPPLQSILPGSPPALRKLQGPPPDIPRGWWSE